MIELSSTSGYAVLALAFLVGRDGRWVLARDIAAATEIAGPYLSRILHTLAKAGLIRAKRGYRGGFVLARPAAKIRLLEIVGAVEERSMVPKCLLGLAECSDERNCPMHKMWKSACARIEACLQRLTLADVAPAVCRHARPASRKAKGYIKRSSQKAVPVSPRGLKPAPRLDIGIGSKATGEMRFAPQSPGPRSGPRSKLAASLAGRSGAAKRGSARRL